MMLRMVRLKSKFAVYKSRDGRFWSMISNVSGGPITFDGPVQLGVFVSSDIAGRTATATFDSIAIGASQMRYKTSWVGNTFGSREEDQHVSNAISAMWVAPDGTCYTMFCNTYDVDPASDGTELYGTYNHLDLDLDQTEPGREQRYVGYNWDLRRFGEPDRAGSSQAIVRRLGSEKRLTMFTSGQGTIGDIKIFRYDGELAIPAGGTREHGSVLWIDGNGDGRQEPEELTNMASPIGWITSLCVDSQGDLWAANATTGGCFMRHFFFKGLTAQGVPVYNGLKDEGYEDIRFPEEGDKINAWGMACRMDYDAERDILVAFYPAVPRTGEGDTSPAQYYFGRYDNWSQGQRTPRWKQRALEPQLNPDFFMYEKNLFPDRGYMGLQIAGDYVFFAYLFGEIHVFELATGKLVEILALGPEVNGQSAWEDAAMGLRAFRRKNGEYLIFTENSGWGGKNNFFRWRP